MVANEAITLAHSFNDRRAGDRMDARAGESWPRLAALEVRVRPRNGFAPAENGDMPRLGFPVWSGIHVLPVHGISGKVGTWRYQI